MAKTHSTDTSNQVQVALASMIIQPLHVTLQ